MLFLCRLALVLHSMATGLQVKEAFSGSTLLSSNDDTCARSFEQVAPQTGYEAFEEALQGDCTDDSFDFNETIVALLKRRFSDVRVYRGRPIDGEEAKTWRKKVVVIQEGLFRQVEHSTHYFNIASMEIPNLARMVLTPLREAGRLDEVEVIIPKEHPLGECTIPEKLFAKTSKKRFSQEELRTLTYARLRRECRSGIEIIPSVFPRANIVFGDNLPQCEGFNQCYGFDSKSDDWLSDEDATVLYFTKTMPVGNMNYNEGCKRESILAARDWVLGLTGVKTKVPNQILLIKRGTDLNTTSENYHYERKYGTLIPNWSEIENTLAPWAKARGYDVKSVVLEDLPFLDQARMFSTSKILVGYEGAALANMIYFADPRKSAVIELNSDNGKISDDQEFPSLARTMNTHLFQHIFKCESISSEPVNPQALLQTVSHAMAVVDW